MALTFLPHAVAQEAVAMHGKVEHGGWSALVLLEHSFDVPDQVALSHLFFLNVELLFSLDGGFPDNSKAVVLDFPINYDPAIARN